MLSGSRVLCPNCKLFVFLEDGEFKKECGVCGTVIEIRIVHVHDINSNEPPIDPSHIV